MNDTVNAGWLWFQVGFHVAFGDFVLICALHGVLTVLISWWLEH